jgi:RimJ/RimL family protein N-acetyltransferase
MFSMWREPAVCRFSGAACDSEGRRIELPATNATESDRIIDFFLQRWSQGSGCRWALITRNERRFVGTAGFNNLSDCSEYAYHLHPEVWGCGLMREASQVLIAWLSLRSEATAVEAFINPGNRPSIRLAESLGFKACGQVIDDTVRYYLPLDFHRRQA